MNPRFPLIAIVATLVATALPSMVQAKKLDLYNPHKHYGDEKTAISDPTSRCTGASFQKLHTNAEILAKSDLKKFTNEDGNVSQPVADAFKIYAQDIALGWEAMQQPYCGFGAFGSSAAQKSLDKTLTRARADFLAKAEKHKTDDATVLASTLTLLPSSSAAIVPASVIVTPSTHVTTTSTTTSAPKSTVTADTSDATPSITHALKLGDRSTEVTRLQAFLATKGYLPRGSATGYFGPSTQKALIRFQKAKHIITTSNSSGAGVVGPKTRDLINT